MDKPILDRKPTGRPHDWSYRKIKLARPIPIGRPIRPVEYKNPYYEHTAPRDQNDRGTCCGQSGGYAYDLLYMMLTKDVPKPEDKAQYKKDVKDSLGTIHDILYRTSASAECFYAKSREIGNIDYPEGSETRFVGKAWTKYGMNLEDQWHTAKTPYNVWDSPRQTSDGGLGAANAETFAGLHKAEGWAMVGDEYGNASWDEVCDAIYEKGFVIAGIPVYENYGDMQGGDGGFPEPKGSIVGYHALCLFGYDEKKIYLLHSWGDWVPKVGYITRTYLEHTIRESVYIVILDSNEVVIGREQNAALTITVKDIKTKEAIPATISVGGVTIGKSPQKIAVELGKTYIITAEMVGYKPSKLKYVMSAKRKRSLRLSLYQRKGGS